MGLMVVFLCIFSNPAIAAAESDTAKTDKEPPQTEITEELMDNTDKLSNEVTYKMKLLYEQGLEFIFSHKWYIMGLLILSFGMVFLPIPELIRFFFIRTLIITVLGLTLYITAPILVGEITKGL